MSNPAESMVWSQDLTTLHGKIVPRATALAPDQKAVVQVIGPPESLRMVEVAGEITDDASARQVAAYMVMTVRLILPQWAGADRWLTQGMRAVKRKEQAITMQGWKLRMQWQEPTKTVTLKATH
jgi:hypothetical protein